MFGSNMSEEQAQFHLEMMNRSISLMSQDDQKKIRAAIETLRQMVPLDPVCMSVAFTFVAGETMIDLMAGKYREKQNDPR